MNGMAEEGEALEISLEEINESNWQRIIHTHAMPRSLNTPSAHGSDILADLLETHIQQHHGKSEEQSIGYPPPQRSKYDDDEEESYCQAAEEDD